MHLAAAVVDRDHRGLGQHDAAAAHVDEGVRGAKIDGHVARAEAGQEVEEADGVLLSTDAERRWYTLRLSVATAGDDSGAVPAASANAGVAEGAEGVDQQRHRQADDVEVVALDGGHKRRADALDRVGAGALAPLAAGHVAVDVAVARGRKVTAVTA